MPTVVRYPSTSVADGTAWTNPANAHADDATYATAAPAKNGTIASRWSGFDFDNQIPAGATIDSVTVEVQWKVSTTASVATLGFQCYVSGAAQGTEYTDTSEPTSDTVRSRAESASYTRDDLLDAAFAVRARATRGNSNTAVTASLDYITVTVVYTPGAQGITPTAIASAEVHGAAVVQPGAVAVLPSGIASPEAFGTPVVELVQAQEITAQGIATVEGFGGAVLAPSAVAILAVGIAGAETLGTPALAPGPVALAPAGIGSGEAFGLSVLAAGAIQVQVAGIAGAEGFGQASLAPGAVALALTGLPSAEAFGTPALATGAVLAVAGIASAEAFGQAAVAPGPVTVGAQGIASAEAWGTATVATAGLGLLVQGIGSGQAFGTASLVPGAVALLAAGIASGEVWGTPRLTVTGGGVSLTVGEAPLNVAAIQVIELAAAEAGVVALATVSVTDQLQTSIARTEG